MAIHEYRVRPFRESSAAGWWNTLSLARDLRVDDAGRLLPRPAPALEKLRSPKVHHDLESLAVASSEIRLQFPTTSIGQTTLRIAGGTQSLAARYDHAKQEVQLDLARFNQGLRKAPLPRKPGEPVTLRVFVDRSIFEVYANDEIVISAVAFFADPTLLTAKLESDVPVELDAWEMNALTWSPYQP